MLPISSRRFLLDMSSKVLQEESLHDFFSTTQHSSFLWKIVGFDIRNKGICFKSEKETLREEFFNLLSFYLVPDPFEPFFEGRGVGRRTNSMFVSVFKTDFHKVSECLTDVCLSSCGQYQGFSGLRDNGESDILSFYFSSYP